MKFPLAVVCGSLQKVKDVREVEETLAYTGRIVLYSGCDLHEQKETYSWLNDQLDKCQKEKIDMADEVYIIMTGDHLGESTQEAWSYAICNSKHIIVIEDIETWKENIGHEFLHALLQ